VSWAKYVESTKVYENSVSSIMIHDFYWILFFLLCLPFV